MTEDHNLTKSDVGTVKEVARMETGRNGVGFSLSCSANGKLLVTGDDSGGLSIWDLGARKLLLRPRIDLFGWKVIAISPNGRYVAAGGGRSVRLMFTTSGTVARRFDVYEGHIGKVVFSPDGRLLAISSSNPGAITSSGYPEGVIWVWEVETGEEMA